MTATYHPILGYTVRDSRGRILASGLSVVQRDALLAQRFNTVLDLSVVRS